MSEGKIPLRRTSGPTDPAQAKEQPRYPTDTISLPTKGWFYPENTPLATGEVEIKQMTAREEDILANQDLIRRGKVLDKLLQSLLIDKNINPEDILIPDKNAIFIAIRRFAYGDNYSVNVTCPQCGVKSRVDINLAELKDKEIDLSLLPRWKNNFTFVLPKAGTVLTYKLLNQKDEDDIEREITALRKVNKEASSEVTTRLKYVITAIDGNPDKDRIRKFVDEEFLAVDARAFRNSMKANTPDIDMQFDFKCSNSRCEHERRMDIPVGASFLWIDIES